MTGLQGKRVAHRANSVGVRLRARICVCVCVCVQGRCSGIKTKIHQSPILLPHSVHIICMVSGQIKFIQIKWQYMLINF